MPTHLALRLQQLQHHAQGVDGTDVCFFLQHLECSDKFRCIMQEETPHFSSEALHFASLHGHVEVVRQACFWKSSLGLLNVRPNPTKFHRNLIDRRANVNALDDHGWAPLHLAAAAGMGHLPFLQVLGLVERDTILYSSWNKAVLE